MPDLSNENTDSPVSGLTATAIEYAKSFDKDFDFSRESIENLEKILEYYHQDISKEQPTENQIYSMALIFGSYLGESILRNASKKDYTWKMTEDEPILYKDSAYQMAPVAKVYKRLVNGPEDNVISFFDIALHIAEGGQI